MASQESSPLRRFESAYPRAEDKHARFVVCRSALLRDQVHRVEGQIREEGLTVPFLFSILAEAVLSGKAMLTVNGSTPYNAVYGRVPSLLPSKLIRQIRRLIPPQD